jgi:uncharacterized protein
MVIDVHTHLFPDEVRQDRSSFCRRDRAFQIIYGNEKSRLAGPEDLVDMMDRNGVHRSVICGFPWKDPGLCREGNDYLLYASGKYPNRLIPFASLPVCSPRRAERMLNRCLAQGMAGIGELAFYERGISPKDIRCLSSLVRPLAGQGIPLLLHVNEPVGHDYPGKTPQDLQVIYRLLLALPDLVIILAHWGGGFFFYELMPEVAQAAKNVFYDTAASPLLFRPQIYGLAVQIIGSDRILWGSDYPLLSPARYFREMEDCPLPRRVQAKIKGCNAQRLLWRKESKDGPLKENQV